MIEQGLDYYIQKIFDHISSNKKIVDEETYRKYKNESKTFTPIYIKFMENFK